MCGLTLQESTSQVCVCVCVLHDIVCCTVFVQTLHVLLSSSGIHLTVCVCVCVALCCKQFQ